MRYILCGMYGIRYVGDSTWNISKRILQNMISGMPLLLAIEPEDEIAMLVWSLGPYV